MVYHPQTVLRSCRYRMIRRHHFRSTKTRVDATTICSALHFAVLPNSALDELSNSMNINNDSNSIIIKKKNIMKKSKFESNTMNLSSNKCLVNLRKAS